MKVINFKTWKKTFMKETHPKTGDKFAIRLEDFHQKYSDIAKPLDSIKGIKFSIVYRSGAKTDSVVEFDKLGDFGKAQSYTAYHSWPFVEFPDNALMINMGCADLQAVIPYSKENTAIAVSIGTPRPTENYDGREIQ
jgi:hypothetical protein